MSADDATGRAGEPGRVGFAVGTGRCGTHFLARILAAEPGVVSSHERGRFAEAFHRYCRWYRLPVDEEGFFAVIEAEIAADLRRGRFSFEASTYLSLSVGSLAERFQAKCVLMVRRPDEVVNSYWSKGWYAEPYVQHDVDRALGYQPLRTAHNYFARLAPGGAAFTSWNAMTRIGKIAWFWNAINAAVLDQFAALSPSQVMVVRLEELSYEVYREMAGFLGIRPVVTAARFAATARHRPGRRGRSHAVADWSTREAAEFEEQVRPVAQRLGYEYRAALLVHPDAASRPPSLWDAADGVRRAAGVLRRRARAAWHRVMGNPA